MTTPKELPNSINFVVPTDRQTKRQADRDRDREKQSYSSVDPNQRLKRHNL